MSTKGHAATRYVGTNAERLAQETSILTIGTTWIETDGNFAAYAWNGSIWIRTQDTYQQTVTVVKSGGDFTTIQGAIDSITDATTSKRYCVLVYPGDYAETVVGSDYIEIMGLKAREAVNITGATGPLYTFPDNEGHIFNLKFSLSPTTAAQEIISVPATVVARQAIANCLFVSTSASDVATSILDVDGGTLDFFNNRIVMTNTNTTGGAIRTQRVFDISGDAALHIYNNAIDVDIYDINDRITVLDDGSTTGGVIDFSYNLVNLNSHNVGAYSGIIRALNLVSTVGRTRCLSNSIAITSLETGGTGRGEYIRINTAAGGGLVASTANQVRIEGFATNYWGNAAAGDEISSHFDDLVAAGSTIGAGTFTFANSQLDGDLNVSNDIIMSGGTLEMIGDATVWDDIFFPMSSGRIGGGNTPTWTAFQGNTYEYVFALNDYIHLPSGEITHKYKEGSDIELHCHIVLNGSDVGDTYVNYEIEYTIGDMGEVMSAAATITSGDTLIAGGTADRTHIYVDIGDITGTGYKLGAALKMRFRRIALVGGGLSDPTSDPFVLMVGVHIEMDTIGSRTETAK